MGPLADNSGPTFTHELPLGSPAVDAGNNAECPVTDQRGVTRPQGLACDIGAYEEFHADKDGIHAEVDTDPSAFSNDFSDGTSSGVILSRGGQILAVNPADSIKITAGPSGVSSEARVSVCGGAANFSFGSEDSLVFTCGIVSVSRVSGTVDVEFVGDNGTVAATTLDEGDAITFDPVTPIFIVPIVEEFGRIVNSA